MPAQGGQTRPGTTDRQMRALPVTGPAPGAAAAEAFPGAAAPLLAAA